VSSVMFRFCTSPAYMVPKETRRRSSNEQCHRRGP
jgi:hypothetical protein